MSNIVRDDNIGVRVTIRPDHDLHDVAAQMEAVGVTVDHLFGRRGVAMGSAPRHTLSALRSLAGVDGVSITDLSESAFQLPPRRSDIPQ
jgi:hypothetical protein